MIRFKTTIRGKITKKEKEALSIVSDLMGEISMEMNASDFYTQVDKGVHCLATDWGYLEDFLSSLIENCDLEEEES